MLLIILFLARNTACLNIKVKDVASLITRSSLLYIINLVPLALREYINLVARFYGVKLNVYASIYKWLKRVVIIKGLIYLIAALSSQRLNLQSILKIIELIISHLRLIDFVRLISLKAAIIRILLLLSSLI